MNAYFPGSSSLLAAGRVAQEMISAMTPLFNTELMNQVNRRLSIGLAKLTSPVKMVKLSVQLDRPTSLAF